MIRSALLWFEVVSNKSRNNSWLPYVEPSAGVSERRVCAGLFTFFPSGAHLDEQLPVSRPPRERRVSVMFPALGLKTLSVTRVIKFSCFLL